MDPDQIHLVTAHVTATVSSRLTGLLRLVSPRKPSHHIDGKMPHEVAKSPRSLPACIPRRLEWTLHLPDVTP